MTQAQRPLPSEPTVQRSSDRSTWVQFSTTSEFRFIHDGAPGVPDFYEERSTRGDGPPMHRHPWASWELVIDGTLRVVIDGKEFRVGPGDAIYVPPNSAHAYVVESETSHVVGVNMSDGRFAKLQRGAAPIFASEGGPDMGKVMALAQASNVELLGPPLAAGTGA